MSASHRRRSLHEAAHKAPDARNGDSAPVAKPGPRRNFNMAAHKLGYWPVAPAPQRNAVRSSIIRRSTKIINSMFFLFQMSYPCFCLRITFF